MYLYWFILAFNSCFTQLDWPSTGDKGYFKSFCRTTYWTTSSCFLRCSKQSLFTFYWNVQWCSNTHRAKKIFFTWKSQSVLWVFRLLFYVPDMHTKTLFTIGVSKNYASHVYKQTYNALAECCRGSHVCLVFRRPGFESSWVNHIFR